MNCTKHKYNIYLLPYCSTFGFCLFWFMAPKDNQGHDFSVVLLHYLLFLGRLGICGTPVVHNKAELRVTPTMADFLLGLRWCHNIIVCHDMIYVCVKFHFPMLSTSYSLYHTVGALPWQHKGSYGVVISGFLFVIPSGMCIPIYMSLWQTKILTLIIKFRGRLRTISVHVITLHKHFNGSKQIRQCLKELIKRVSLLEILSFPKWPPRYMFVTAKPTHLSKK